MATARQLVEDAFEMAGIFKPTQTIAAQDAAFGIKTLNRVLQEYQNAGYFPYGQTLTTYTPSVVKNPYTIGVSGVDIVVSGYPNDVLGVVLVGQDARTPLQKVSYQDFVTKYETTGATAGVYAYNRKADSGEIWFDGGAGSFEVLTNCAFPTYGLDDQVTLPVGYFGLLVAEVAARCSPAYGVDPTFCRQEAARMLDNIQIVNAGPPLMEVENPLRRGRYYDIQNDVVY